MRSMRITKRFKDETFAELTQLELLIDFENL
jgi:hypothetical protein